MKGSRIISTRQIVEFSLSALAGKEEPTRPRWVSSFARPLVAGGSPKLAPLGVAREPWIDTRWNTFSWEVPVGIQYSQSVVR